MSNNNHSGGIFAGKGFVLALILCAAAIGVTGYLYSKNDWEAQSVSLQETREDLLVGAEGTEDVAVLATQPPATQEARGTAPAPQPTEKPTLKTMSPVEGDPISGFSVEALSYNQTTRDWRIHNGVDLAADANAPVAAAADGEIYTTYCDDAMGYTVVIRHMDGYTTKYSSLAENLTVRPGDKVTMGQTIGYAADTAIVESTLGAHVHFSVTKQDEPLDPAEFLAIGQ